jgi:hypothetical protein
MPNVNDGATITSRDPGSVSKSARVIHPKQGVPDVVTLGCGPSRATRSAQGRSASVHIDRSDPHRSEHFRLSISAIIATNIWGV